MARPPKGKPLTYRPIRLDDDVWKECQRLGKEHGTINEGLRVKLLPADLTSNGVHDVTELMYNERALGPSVQPSRRSKSWKREPREKGDKTR